MNWSADECPTRRYPINGPWRFECSGPEYYDAADVAERLTNSNRRQIEQQIQEEMMRLFMYGETLCCTST